MLEFVCSPIFSMSTLDFYNNFVSEFESKMNKLSLSEVVKLAVQEIQDVDVAKEFLKKIEPKVCDQHKSYTIVYTILLKIN